MDRVAESVHAAEALVAFSSSNHAKCRQVRQKPMGRQTHVQIEFEFACTLDEYRNLAEHAAPNISGVPGLVSKLWIVDAERRRAGGALPLFGSRRRYRVHRRARRRRAPREPGDLAGHRTGKRPLG